MKLLALIPTERLSEVPVAHTTHNARREDLYVLDGRSPTGRHAGRDDTAGRTLVVFDSKEARRAGFKIDALGGLSASCDALAG